MVVTDMRIALLVAVVANAGVILFVPWAAARSVYTDVRAVRFAISIAMCAVREALASTSCGGWNVQW